MKSTAVEMELFRIRTDDKGGDQLVILKEKSGDRMLPIVIGFFEADSIRMHVTGLKLPRPFTHDLLQLTIQGLDASVDRIIVDALKDRTFHAKLVLKTAGGELKRIDARPSDAIALAVRTCAPIYVAEEVLEQTGVQEDQESP